MSNLWKTKSIKSLQEEAQDVGGLSKTLGARALISLGVGAIIGAGLFSLTGITAAENAGPAVILSFIFAAIGCAFAGLCYAEFASMIPVAGSAYTYSYATMGEFVAWVIGWDLVLEYALASAAVSASWSQYVAKLFSQFGIAIPKEFLYGPWEGGLVNLPAVFIVCILSLLLIKGIRESALMNNILVVLKVSVVVLFIVLGWNFINHANHVPFIPTNEGEEMLKSGDIGLLDFFRSDFYGRYGWSGVLRGAGVLFFAFIGFDAVSTAAQEAKNPQRNMPIGIIGSLIICTILYVLFSYVLTGLENYTVFKDDASPVATAFAKTGYTFINSSMTLAIVAGYTTVILVMLMGQSRVFYSMSTDGLLPKFFSELHPKNKTPWKTNLVFLVFVSILAGFVPISELGHMVSIGTLFAFTLVCLGVIVMRKTHPDMKRSFKTPLVPLVPMLGIIICVLLMAGLPLKSWERLGIWLAIGLIVYFLYGKNHSKLNNDKK
ncbi:MAG: amino acid permease [Bergeyella sp.]|nr:amino acid permease [Bergeyella sp.]